jgi:hypothetical protein
MLLRRGEALRERELPVLELPACTVSSGRGSTRCGRGLCSGLLRPERDAHFLPAVLIGLEELDGLKVEEARDDQRWNDVDPVVVVERVPVVELPRE